MDLLCVGDLHLGRRPAHSSVAAAALSDADAITPRAAWQRCVRYALEQGVSAVVLTGDLTEDAKDFFGAYTDLEQGIRELRDAGIRVIAVAGNHDHVILPALGASVQGLELLGAGGHWEATVVEGPDARVELVGWSFTREAAASPLTGPQDLPARVADECPRIGVMHCDVDGRESSYAPVARSTLDACNLDGWLLGHIHVPDDLANRGPDGYLGSVVGLDPTEHGPRGPWHLRVAPSGACTMEHVLLAPLRWEYRDVDVSDVSEPAELHAQVVSALQVLDREIAAQARTHPDVVGVRLELTGRSAIRAALQAEIDSGSLQESTFPVGEALYFIDRQRLTARPAVDLEQRARGEDPTGLIARRLLALEDPDSSERQALVERARRELESWRTSAPFARLQRPAITDDEAVAYLREAGLKALDALIEQEAGPA